MNTTRTRWLATPLLLTLAPWSAGCGVGASPLEAAAQESAAVEAPSYAAATARTFQVSGSAVHYFTTAAVHSEQPTGAGKIQRSTEIIRLTGDLDGYILYHPTSTFDFAAGTLVNTGTQIFSGTIDGSEPMILHDDRFRFEVDLATGATLGEVHLSRSKDAPEQGGWYDCDLEVVGTGMTPEGDGMADYTGTCTARGAP